MKSKLMILMGCLSLACSVMPVSAQTQMTNKQYVETQELPELIVDKTGSGELLDEPCNSVLQIIVTYTTEDGETIPIQGGSGFFIGNEDEQMQYLVTTQKVITVDEELKKKIRKKCKIKKDTEINTKIEIVISKDVTIEASVVTASEEMDFAILRLNQPIHGRQSLLLNDKGISDYLRDTVAVIGYPSSAQYDEELIYYTSEDLQKNEGFLEVEKVINGQKYIQHHIFPNYGNIGGPIVTKEFVVLGLNQQTNDGKNFYALEIQQIMSVCDSLGIPYKTISMQEKEKEAAIAAIVHKEKLVSVINKAEKTDSSAYKKDSIALLEKELENAKDINDNPDATQNQVDEAQINLQTVLDGLIPKMPIQKVLMITGIIALISLSMVLIILRLTHKKRAKRREEKKAQFLVTQPAPDFSNEVSAENTCYKELIKAGNNQMSDWVNDYNETVVLGLNSDLAETSVLMQQQAVLVREKDNEKISVYKFPFIIGKGKNKADYCIQDNIAISRIHAIIYSIGNSYYIEDKNSTNGTFINGKRIQAEEKIELKDNDFIKLANEKFNFRTSEI